MTELSIVYTKEEICMQIILRTVTAGSKRITTAIPDTYILVGINARQG